MTTYTVELEGENSDILPIPEELCKSLGWNVGDTLLFRLENDTVILSKKVYPNPD